MDWLFDPIYHAGFCLSALPNAILSNKRIKTKFACTLLAFAVVVWLSINPSPLEPLIDFQALGYGTLGIVLAGIGGAALRSSPRRIEPYAASKAELINMLQTVAIITFACLVGFSLAMVALALLMVVAMYLGGPK